MSTTYYTLKQQGNINKRKSNYVLVMQQARYCSNVRLEADHGAEELPPYQRIHAVQQECFGGEEVCQRE